MNNRKQTSNSDKSEGDSFVSEQMSSENTTDYITIDTCHKHTQYINDKPNIQE